MEEKENTPLMESGTMKIKTNDGIAEGMPLSDIQRNNKLLKGFLILGIIIFAYVLFMTWYIIHNNVLNNALNTLGGCI